MLFQRAKEKELSEGYALTSYSMARTSGKIRKNGLAGLIRVKGSYKGIEIS
jgi:hypothetical protein